ncbi:MAG: DNRLRE domain-containing protein, partial [Woeseia sp.]
MRSMHRKQQQGFLLVTVITILAILAAIAMLLSTSTSMDNVVLANHTKEAELNYVAEAGMAHARWQLGQNTSCTNYASLPATSFGSHSYSASFTPTSGSPISVLAVGSLTTGAVHTISRDNVRSYETPTTLFLQPGTEGEDAEIWAQAPNNNYGDAAETWVSSATNDTTRSLLRFNVDAIPAGVKIIDATLSLRRQSGSGSQDPVSAHRITNQWSEAAVTWNRREVGTNWDTPGVDFDSAAVATTLVGPPNGRFEWNIAPLVQGWVDGSFPNHGVVLVAATAGMSGERFYTSDAMDSPRHPSLDVTYACECGGTCTTVSGTIDVPVISGNDDAEEN